MRGDDGFLMKASMGDPSPSCARSLWYPVPASEKRIVRGAGWPISGGAQGCAPPLGEVHNRTKKWGAASMLGSNRGEFPYLIYLSCAPPLGTAMYPTQGRGAALPHLKLAILRPAILFSDAGTTDYFNFRID